MLAERGRLVQDGDVHLAQRPSRIRVPLDEAGELDGAGKTRRAGADEDHVHLDGLGVRRLPEDHPVAG